MTTPSRTVIFLKLLLLFRSRIPLVQNGFPDSGASSHITNSAHHLQQSQPYVGSDSVMVGDGAFLPITHVGSTNLPSSSGSLPLNEVLVCPSITKSLLSVSKLCDDLSMLL